MEKNGRKKREHYSMRTRLIHGSNDTRRWDFNHHLVPPLSASTSYDGKFAPGSMIYFVLKGDEKSATAVMTAMLRSQQRQINRPED